MRSCRCGSTRSSSTSRCWARRAGTTSRSSARGCRGSASIVCTGQSSVAQRVRGLRLGADDWMTKPCHPEELIARVEAVVRRRKRAEARVDAGPLVIGEVEVRPDQFQAFVGGVSAPISRAASSSSSSCSPTRRGRSCSARRSTSGSGATRWSTATGRSTCSCASCGRSWRRCRPAGATSTRTSGSGTGSRPSRPTRWRRSRPDALAAATSAAAGAVGGRRRGRGARARPDRRLSAPGYRFGRWARTATRTCATSRS